MGFNSDFKGLTIKSLTGDCGMPLSGLKQVGTPMISEHIKVNYETRLASSHQDIYSEVYECEITNANRGNK